MNTIKVGFLGAGFMNITHARNLSMFKDVQCVCIASRSQESIKNFNQSTELELKGYTDFDLMLEENEIDVLVVAIPPYAHDGQVEKAAKKGIHLFLEKPIAISVERAESMVEAVKASGVKSQVGYHMRFGDAVMRVKELLYDEDVIITSYQASYECNALHGPWWRDKSKSGGQVLEQIIHLYDMAMYLCGKPKMVVGAMSNMCHKEVDGYTVEDTSAALIQFESGTVATLTGSNCAIPGQWNGKFKIITNKFVADFEDFNNVKIIYTSDDPEVEEEEIYGCSDVYFDEIRYFLDTVEGRAANICTIEEGLESLRLVENVTKSAEQGSQLVKF